MSTPVTATATTKDGKRQVTVNYDFGDNLDEMVAKFGAEVVYSQALDALVISAQAMIRRHAAGTDKTPPKSDEQIQEIVSAWVPGKGKTRKSASEKAADLIKGMSEEDRQALLASLGL